MVIFYFDSQVHLDFFLHVHVEIFQQHVKFRSKPHVLVNLRISVNFSLVDYAVYLTRLQSDLNICVLTKQEQDAHRLHRLSEKPVHRKQLTLATLWLKERTLKAIIKYKFLVIKASLYYYRFVNTIPLFPYYLNLEKKQSII